MGALRDLQPRAAPQRLPRRAAPRVLRTTGLRAVAAQERERSLLAPVLIVALGAIATSGARNVLSVDEMQGGGGGVSLEVAAALAGILLAGALLDVLAPMASGLVSLVDSDGEKIDRGDVDTKVAPETLTKNISPALPEGMHRREDASEKGNGGEERWLLLFRCPSRWTSGFGRAVSQQDAPVAPLSQERGGQAGPRQGVWPGMEGTSELDWRHALPVLELQASVGEQGWALEPYGEEAPMLWWVVGEEGAGRDGKALSDAVRGCPRSRAWI